MLKLPLEGYYVGKVRFKKPAQERLTKVYQAALESGDQIILEKARMALGMDNHFGIVKDNFCRTYGPVKDIYLFTTSTSGINSNYLRTAQIWHGSFSGSKSGKSSAPQYMVTPAQRVPADAVDVEEAIDPGILTNISECNGAIADATTRVPSGN